MKVIAFFARLAVAAVFLYAGASKAGSDEFAAALVPFTFVPDTWIGPIALILPQLEILCGVLLLVPWTLPQSLGAALALALSLVFIFTLSWALANDIIVSCACFGQDETPSARKMQTAVGRDVLLALGAALVLADAWLRRRRSPDKIQKTPTSG